MCTHTDSVVVISFIETYCMVVHVHVHACIYMYMCICSRFYH